MAWDSEVYLPKDGAVFSDPNEKTAKRPIRCAECSGVISVVSAALYEIDNKNYCPECYHRKILALAAERDHSDLKQEKEILQK